MTLKLSVHPDTFTAIENVDVDHLSELPEWTLRPILPCLVRMSLCAPLDSSVQWTDERKKILKCLSGIEVINSLVGLLSIDFHELEQDAKKEQQMRNKIDGSQTESPLISQLEHGLALEFERCDAARKLRLLLSELLFIMSKIKEKPDYFEKSSELFDSDVHLEEVSDVLCIAQAELPNLLPIVDVAEALLHMQNGGWLLCRLVANSPDTFHEVCRSLVCNGEKQDEESEGGRRRCEVLVMLALMCPAQLLSIRSLCVEYCKQPALAVMLTLKYEKQFKSKSNDCSQLVAFVSGLLLDNDANIRNWFGQFIRGSQKKKDGSSVVMALRHELLKELDSLLKQDIRVKNDVVEECAFIRLFSALKCIAGIKFTDEENIKLLELITSKPPATDAGIRYICLGLCMLLACPTLVSNAEQEKQVIEWLRYLTNEEQFERSSAKASFGEMLLLIAIHFHSNQSNAISDLVSSTLGMKSAVKSAMLGRMKAIFIQEIFTEQVVTAHAVKVSVTENLSANISGYLPIHCIYQLLRSRAFSKYNVPIKDWIYKQLFSCVTPIHPLIPSLIEVYINSIILPIAKSDRTNDPISEEELLAVFIDSPLLGGSRTAEPMEVSGDEMKTLRKCDPGSGNVAPQVLLLYYTLLYEDILLQNTNTILAHSRKVYRYRADVFAMLPTKYLLQQTQREPSLYAGINSSLLRLLAAHYPHHCLVSDWFEESTTSRFSVQQSHQDPQQLLKSLTNAVRNVDESPGRCVEILEQMSACTTERLTVCADQLIKCMPLFLSPSVPRRCKQLIRDVWMKLNNTMPISFRVDTVNALSCRGSHRLTDKYTEQDITTDPLIVLRCDRRVFRCPPFMEIVLNILEAFLLACRSYLSTYAQTNVIIDKSGQMPSSKERDDLLSALVVTQESAVVQILLEICLPDDNTDQSVMMSDVREVQGLVCSTLHHMFITDPGLAKLVHFQGYHCSLLPLTVSAIPSMHICLDFVAELIAQPDLQKQVFCIELISYLSVQYPIPKSMSVVKLAVNVMNTLLCVLCEDDRTALFSVTLDSLSRMCRAFPPLCDEAIALLVQLARVTHSHLSTTSNISSTGCLELSSVDDSLDLSRDDSTHLHLFSLIRHTYRHIIHSTTLLKPHIPSHNPLNNIT